MTLVATVIDVKMIQRTWAAFDQIAHLRPIRSAVDYDRTVGLMNQLLEVAGDDEDHPLSGLIDLVSNLVEDFDSTHYSIEPSEPKEVLRQLLEMHGMKQSDLADIIPQSNLSAVLAGKRKISATLAAKLASRFGVSPAVFILEDHALLV